MQNTFWQPFSVREVVFVGKQSYVVPELLYENPKMGGFIFGLIFTHNLNLAHAFLISLTFPIKFPIN